MGRPMSIYNNFLTCFGLSCLSEVKEKDGKIRYEQCGWKFAIPAVIITAISIFVYFLILTIKTQLADVPNLGGTVLTNLLNLTGNIVAAICIFFSAVNTKNYAQLRNGFLLFDTKVTIEHETIIRSIWKYTALFTVMYFLSFLCDYMVYVYNPNEYSILIILAAYIFQIYNLLAVMQYSICLFWLRKSFILINTHIARGMQKIQLSPKFQENNIDKMNVISFENVINFNKSTTIHSQIKDEDVINCLRYLRHWYHTAYLLSQDVNQVFSTRNLITVGHNFVLGTIYMYSGISELVRTPTAIELIVHFKWSLICFMSIYGLIWPSTATCNEAKKSAVKIQEILIKAANEDIRSELSSFSLQFAHENVVFSPHGFFCLNNNLLLSIIGAVVSYLIILIQFRISIG